jgi:carboxypeptidase family protein/PDZ domain-containing protein
LRRVAVLVISLAALAVGVLWVRNDARPPADAPPSSSEPIDRSQRETTAAPPGSTGPVRSASSAAAVAVAAPAAEGGTPMLEPPATPADGFAEVRVLSSDRAVPGARVVLYWRNVSRLQAAAFRVAGGATTGHDGAVRLPARAGAYLVSVHAPPLATAEKEFVRPAGAPITRVEVKLSPAYVLRGRTLSRGTSEPVAQARIVVSEALRAAGPGFRGGRRAEALPPEERAVAESDASGRFQVGGLSPGTWSVEATSVGHSRAVARVAVPHDGDLVLELPDAAVIEGKVLAAGGSSADGAEVIASSRANQAATIAAQGGGFSLEVEPGSYHLSARLAAEAGAQAAPISVAAGQTVRGMVLQLGTASAIAGTVFAQSSGRPISGATVVLTSMGSTSVAGMATSDAAGTFSIGGLAPGSYDAAVHADGFSDQVRRGITVAAAQTFPLQVPLTGTGAVSGVVIDAAGRPLGGAVVRVAPGFGPDTHAMQAQVVTGIDGRYRLDNLTAGTVRLAASRDESSFGPGRSVEVGESQESQLDFTLTDNGSLGGRLRHKSGAPADPNTAVRAMQQGDMGNFRDGAVIGSAPVDATGAYQLSLPPGHYRVVAMSPDARRQQPSLATVTANQPTQLDLLLDDTAPGTTGSVVEPSGAPSANATVVLLSAQRQPLGMALTDADGKFTVSQFRGAAPATVRARNGGRIGEVPAGEGNTVVALQSAATLHGTLASGGGPPPSFTVVVAPVDRLGALWNGGGAIPLEFAGDRFDLYDQPGVDVTVVVKTVDGRSGSQTVALRPGQEVTATIALQDSSAISGRVLRTDGQQPVAGALLILDGSARPGSGSLTGSDGRFRLGGLAAGSHTLAVRAGQFAAPPRSLTVDPGQSADLGDIVLPLPKTPSGTIGARFFSSESAVAMGSLVPGGPADLAGILEGDLLVALDGVAVQSPADAAMRSEGAPGTVVSVVLRRAGQASTVQVVRAP